MAIYRGTGSTGTGGESDFAQLAQDAEDAAAAAQLAETNAELAETNAETAASQAESHAYLASLSESQASTSATSASGSASTATTQATNAANSATAAATSASNASTSATNAANSATSASTSASTATTQATNAANSATAAASSASAASTSATNAASSASTATTQATNASNSASAAATSATNASNSASAASTSATNASNSATSASTSATNAAASAAAAAATVTSKVSKSGDVMTGSLEVPTEASLKATALTRPSIRPSLLLDFANTKQLDPRITYSRASTGTYYDGKTVVKAEENLLIYSQGFSIGWGGLTRIAVTANSTTSPDGTTTASTITNTTANGSHVIDQRSSSNYSIVSGLSYTISVYAKKSTNDFLQIATFSGSNVLGSGRANFDLQNGVVGTVGQGTSTIASVGNGWYRCTYTVTAIASGVVNIYFGIITSSTAARFESYTGLGTEAIYLWGAQLEQRSTVTAYTPTTTQPITNYIPALQTAAANVARFDHDPITGESKGFLVEEQRTNLVYYSEQFDNANWTKSNSSVAANTIVAPDGTLTGDKLIDNIATSSHFFFQAYTGSNTTVTASIFVKQAELTECRFFLSNLSTGGAEVTVNLSSGTVGAVTNGGDFTNGYAAIQSAGNGWYRVSLTATKGSTNNTIAPGLFLFKGGTETYTGNGYSGIYIWGAQLETGSFPTSYIPTVASQVTRSGDAARMTGSNFSSWYNQAEGTLYEEYSRITTSHPTSALYAFAITQDGTGNDIIALSNTYNSTADRFVVQSGGSTQADIVIGNAITGNVKKAGAYKTNSFQFAKDGNLGVEDTSGIVPVVTQAAIGCRNTSGTESLNGTIKKLAYYPKRLSNTELQGITS